MQALFLRHIEQTQGFKDMVIAAQSKPFISSSSRVLWVGHRAKHSWQEAADSKQNSEVRDQVSEVRVKADL